MQNCSNLNSLDVSYNKIRELDFSHNKQLSKLSCSGNRLISFDYSLLNPETLTRFLISNNNLPNTNINVFSQFINLKWLSISNSDEKKIKKGIYNHFHGSLESLKNLTKLWRLEISNTDINSGLECLPPSVETIHFSTKERPNCKLKEIEDQLKQFVPSGETYDYKNWKDYLTRMIESKQETSIDNLIIQN